MPEPVIPLAAAACRYLNTVLGEAMAKDLKPWAKARELPHYLQERYAYYTLRLLARPCLLLCGLPGADDTPATLRKHWQTAAKRYTGEVAVALETISSHNRKRLIEQGVPFIVPGTQLYLPQFGAVLSEHFRSKAEPRADTLSAVAQVLLLRYLLGLDPKPLSAMAFARVLDYSKMTLSRAVNELAALGLAEIQPVGREKRLLFTRPARQLWERALPYLGTPVQRRLTLPAATAAALQKQTLLYRAGESALAAASLLGEPAAPVKAIAAAHWPKLQKPMNKYPQGDEVVLELWRYDPGMLTRSKPRQVDTLSLYLSLRDARDERLAMALDNLPQTAWESKATDRE